MQVKKTVTLEGVVISEQVYNTEPAGDQRLKLVGTDFYLPFSSLGTTFKTSPGKTVSWKKM